jgi:nucleotide-binding universal stress UspA family protein
MLALAAGIWLVIGLTLSIGLGRRGHDSFSWFVLGIVFGPFAVVLAIDEWQHRSEHPAEVVAASPVEREADRVDVLVGFDDSDAAQAAIATVVELFGARLGRLTLVSVIPFDGGQANARRARLALNDEAERLAWLAPGLEIVRGVPATALVDTATEGGYDVLAVGSTGAGHARLFGNTARELARETRVPVLVTGSARAA